MIADVIARLKAQVPALKNVEDAGSFIALSASGQAAQKAPAAFVIPAGMVAADPADATGAHLQTLTERLSVVLVLTGFDGPAQGRSADWRDLILAVVHALAGWQPPGFPNVFAFRTAELLSLAGGVASYDLRFHIPSYIRT